jgi:N-acetylmuramoyl-L-alanine amidase
MDHRHGRPSVWRLAPLIAGVLACILALLGCDAGRGLGKLPRVTPTPGYSASATHRSARSLSRAPGRSPGPLVDQVVGIDPGHNGGNFTHPATINRLIWNGREQETCDTTGTETDGDYTEALFNFHVATFLRNDLRRDGARVIMTRRSDSGTGPCVTTRARIINRAHPGVAIDIHADGGPAWGRGFTVLEPVADGPNDKTIAASIRFGADVRAALLRDTSMPASDYYGHGGVIFRNNLAGLNLATEPKILIECGNMRNATDARLLTATWFQRRLARAFTAAIVDFLRHR